MDVFVLYRPTAPSTRAQSIQVVNAAHALASRGHRVELWVEPGPEPGPERPEVLGFYGLAPAPTLAIRVARGGRTAASVAYRLGFAAWIARTRGRGIALARRKRHAAWAVSTFGARFRLVLEVHEVDSRQAADPADAAAAHALEATVLRAAWGVIANADGTLSELRDAHRRLPPARVIHNAARPGAVPAADSHGVGVVGAVRPYKDPQTVAAAAAQLDQPVTWVGATVADGLGDVVVEAPVPYRDVPARIGRFRTLVVPLSPGLFGERLTSPLKLWDALASGIPVVAADTPAIRAAAGDAFLPYVPGDPASLARAITLASTDPAVRASLIARARGRARTWDQRASEVEAFLAETAGSR